MTMLDRMRRHRGWLKWSLALVVLSFIFLYIPEPGRPASPPASGDVVASVDGREITVDRFRRVYNRQMQAYRQAYGANMDERMLKQLGIDQRILEGLIEEEAALAEADRLGIKASDQEVVARIQSLPAFQENGQFVGETRYRQVLERAEPADAPRPVRGAGAPRHRHGEAAGGAHRLDHRHRAGSGRRVQAPQREGQAGGRQLPRRQVPRGDHRDRRRGRRRGSSRTRTTTRFPRSARSSTR